MRTARDKLRAMDACPSALNWIGERTIQQAWDECERSDWMLWLLNEIAPNDPRYRLVTADFAESVWHLISDDPTRFAAAWAISAARRGDAEEMNADYTAAADATGDAADAASCAAEES